MRRAREYHEHMDAPLVPGTTPGDWTVVHDNGDIDRRCGGRIAFTSRRAFEAAGDDLFIHDRDKRWRTPINSLVAGMMSSFPNEYVLILDEMWGWKFPGKCPPMHSARDGFRVLRRLLGGSPNPPQRELYQRPLSKTFILTNVMSSTPERQLCYLDHLRDRWELYRRADKWSPNNRSDDEGYFVVEPRGDWCWVLFSLEAKPVGWARGPFRPVPVHPNTELMVLEGEVSYSDLTWDPESVTRTAPAYLSLA